MKPFRRKALAAAAVVATLVATVTGTAGAAGAADGRAPADGPAPLDAAAKAYLSAYPGLPEAQARRAAEQQDARKSVYEAMAKGGGSDFGGAWFEPPTGVLHVAVTTPAGANRAQTIGRERGLQVQAHLVRRNVGDLERQAEALRHGKDELSQAARGQVGFDVKTNQVVAAVPADQRGRLQQKGVPAGVTLVDDLSLQTEADAGCTSRAACDWTVRAGAMLWRGSAGNNVCSVGFTARNSSNQRYVYTAGHCSNGNGVTWGTGGISIGPMESSVDSGSIDAAVIRVTNSWFAYDQGGEIYMEGDPDRSVDVDYVAPTLSYIWAGDTVCLSANYTQPNGPNYCGVVGTNSDWFVRGMARVDGLDACPGDSGGGWYWLTSSGTRVAYGLHSRSDTGCHGNQGGSRSWFSPLPTIKSNYTPNLNVETR